MTERFVDEELQAIATRLATETLYSRDRILSALRTMVPWVRPARAARYVEYATSHGYDPLGFAATLVSTHVAYRSLTYATQRDSRMRSAYRRRSLARRRRNRR